MQLPQPEFYVRLALGDRVLFVLGLSVLILFFWTIVFAVYTVHLRIRNTRKAARWRRMEEAWQDEILEVLSGAHEPDELLSRVDDKDVLFFVDFILRYVRQLRGEERETLAALAKPYLPRIAANVRRGDAEQRARAVQTLSALGFDEYSQTIVDALDDPAPLVAMVAARALTRPGHPHYARAVLHKLHRLENWSQNYLASMLASVGSEVAHALRDTLADTEKSPPVRTVSAEALQKLNDFAAADIAAKIAEHENDCDLVAACTRLLGRVGRPEHLPVIRTLCDSPEYVLRAHAVRALGRIGDRTDMEILRNAFDDPSQWVAIHAAWGLKTTHGNDVLREIAASDHHRATLAQQALAEEA